MAATIFFACLLAGGALRSETPEEEGSEVSSPVISPIIKCREASGSAAEGLDCEHVFMGVSAGSGFYCALSSTKRVYCWGDNSYGQLGVKKHSSQDRPVEVGALGGRVAKIAAGYYHVCALTADGAVECWGDNRYGQLGDGTRKGSYTPVAVSGLASGVEQIAAGEGHTCVLLRNGSVQCWGKDSSGQLGDGDFKLSKVPVAVSGLPGPVRSLSAGGFHTCAVTMDNNLWCWGDNGRGQLGNMTHDDSARPISVRIPESGALRVSCGKRHTCAVTGDHKLMCWGANDYGQLGNLTHQDTIAPGYVLIASANRGKVIRQPLSRVADVIASEDRTYVIISDGSVKFCGYAKTYPGPMFIELTWNQAIFDFSPPVRGMVMLAAEGNLGVSSACGITAGGELKCWGSGYNGKLGQGNDQDIDKPSPPLWP